MDQTTRRSVLVAEDDEGTRIAVRFILEKAGYDVVTAVDGSDATALIEDRVFDLVILDYFMPKANGPDVLRRFHELGRSCPVVFLSSNQETADVVDVVKSGAEDYIPKPVDREVLLFRAERAIQAYASRLRLETIERERQILAEENKKLVNWRALYATKDIQQTKQMIRLLTRTINQSGGFLWVELFRQMTDDLQDGRVAIPTDMATMIEDVGIVQKRVFDHLTFIAGIDTMEVATTATTVEEVATRMREFLFQTLRQLTDVHGRRIRLSPAPTVGPGSLDVAWDITERVLKEVAANAVKYSPPDGVVDLFVGERVVAGRRMMEVLLRNEARNADAVDAEGVPILGIPYDYSELVFDLFFTIDEYPTTIPEEEWTDGTGLYLCRQLLRRQSAWIEAHNGVDFTEGEARPVVNVTMTFPIQE